VHLTSGATFDLDGTQSSDPDDAIVGHDIRIVSWRNGSRTGPEVGFAERFRHARVGASKTYVLRVIDGYAQADEDAVNVAVVDTTPPSVFCNARRRSCRRTSLFRSRRRRPIYARRPRSYRS